MFGEIFKLFFFHYSIFFGENIVLMWSHALPSFWHKHLVWTPSLWAPSPTWSQDTVEKNGGKKMVKNIFKNTGLKRAATLKCCTQRLKCIYIWTQGARVRSEELLTYVLIYANISAHDFDRDTESFKANPLMLTCLIVIYKWNILRLVLGSNIPQLTVDVKGFDLMENTSF